MYLVQLTRENGLTYSKEFEEYEEMAIWISEEPDAGIMVWEDGKDIGTESFIQLQRDVIEYRSL